MVTSLEESTVLIVSLLLRNNNWSSLLLSAQHALPAGRLRLAALAPRAAEAQVFGRIFSLADIFPRMRINYKQPHLQGPMHPRARLF